MVTPIPVPPAYQRASAWSVLALMILTHITLDLARQPVYFLIDPMQASLGMTTVEISILLGAAMAVPVTVMSLVGGWLSDRVSRRLLLGVSMLCCAGGAIVFATATQYEHLMAGRVLLGIGAGMHIPVAMTWISDAFPGELRGRANALFFIALSLGPAQGGIVTGFVSTLAQQGELTQLPWIGGLESWRLTLLVLALPALLVAPLVLFAPDRRILAGGKPAPHGRDGVQAIGALRWAEWRLPALMIAGVGLMVMVDTANITWMPTVLKRKFDYDEQQVGYAFGAIATIAGIAGPLVGGWVGDAVSRRHGVGGRLWASAVIAVLCTVLLFAYFSTTQWFVLGALALNGVLTVATLVMGYVGLQAVLPPERRGLGTGAMAAGNSLIGATGPTVVAYFSHLIGSGPHALTLATAIVCPALSALAAVAIAMTARAHGRSHPASTPMPSAAAASRHPA